MVIDAVIILIMNGLQELGLLLLNRSDIVLVMVGDMFWKWEWLGMD